MNPEEVVQLLKRARRAANKPFAYALIAEDDTGHPALVVAKTVPMAKKSAKVIRKTAKRKMFALGRIRPTPDGSTLVFILEDGNAKVKLLERSLQKRLAKHADLKKVKGLLQNAVVMTPEAWIEAYGPIPTDSEEDLAGGLDQAMADAKAAYVKAKGVVSAAVLAQLDALKAKATAARKQGDDDALEPYEDLTAACLDAFEEAAGQTFEGSEDDGPDVDVVALHRNFRDAIEKVDAQISALQVALRDHEDDELKEIGDFGLNGITGNHKVPVLAALLSATKTSGDAREANLIFAIDAATDFLNHLKAELRVEACDQNPFGVEVTIKKTLGAALKQIINV